MVDKSNNDALIDITSFKNQEKTIIMKINSSLSEPHVRYTGSGEEKKVRQVCKGSTRFKEPKEPKEPKERTNENTEFYILESATTSISNFITSSTNYPLFFAFFKR
jgi:hypothetical protein